MNHPPRTSSIALHQSAVNKAVAQKKVLHDASSKANLYFNNYYNSIYKQGSANNNNNNNNNIVVVINDEEVQNSKPGPKRLGDPEEGGDIQDVYDFDLEIFHFMKSFEKKNLPSPNLFELQTNIIPKMRATIIDWLVEVHKKRKMHTDTLYLTVYLMDIYLSSNDLDKKIYQRLACAALLIASKSEEIYPPSIRELVELAEQSFTENALSRMEASLFYAADFHVNPILPPQFLKRFLRVIHTDLVLSMLSYYILETSLMDVGFIGALPSKLAASAICLAMTIRNGPGQWTEYMEVNTGFTLEEITPMVDQLLQCVNNYKVSKFSTIRKKYASATMGSVSRISFPGAIKLA